MRLTEALPLSTQAPLNIFNVCCYLASIFPCANCTWENGPQKLSNKLCPRTCARKVYVHLQEHTPRAPTLLEEDPAQ